MSLVKGGWTGGKFESPSVFWVAVLLVQCLIVKNGTDVHLWHVKDSLLWTESLSDFLGNGHAQ